MFNELRLIEINKLINLKYRLIFDLNLVYKIPGVRNINLTIKLHILTVAVLKPVALARYNTFDFLLLKILFTIRIFLLF